MSAAALLQWRIRPIADLAASAGSPQGDCCWRSFTHALAALRSWTRSGHQAGSPKSDTDGSGSTRRHRRTRQSRRIPEPINMRSPLHRHGGGGKPLDIVTEQLSRGVQHHDRRCIVLTFVGLMHPCWLLSHSRSTHFRCSLALPWRWPATTPVHGRSPPSSSASSRQHHLRCRIVRRHNDLLLADPRSNRTSLRGDGCRRRLIVRKRGDRARRGSVENKTRRPGGPQVRQRE
jgi:hypothetical protein